MSLSVRRPTTQQAQMRACRTAENRLAREWEVSTHCCHYGSVALSLPMRWLPLFLVLALGGCAGPKNTFVVQDARGLVSDATLRLCGSETSLVREGQRLSLSRSVTCEGDGEIQLHYTDGGLEHCLIGYVTPQAQQDFQFRADESSCQPVS